LPSNEAFYPRNTDLELPTNPDTTVYWQSVLNVYGTVRPGISQIWLQNPYMDTEIVGTLAFNPTDDRLLIYDVDIDTLPENTLQAVDSVVNPLLKGPGHGLPVAESGQRYLIVEAIGNELNSDPSIAWGNVVANANDIIEFDGLDWVVSLDSVNTMTIEYVTNLTTEVQYRWAESMWMKSYEGWYDQGDYSIVI
jgi:hypothetical protein